MDQSVASVVARYVKDKSDKLTERLQADVFLDSDDLRDLRTLLENVAKTDVLLLFLTKDLLTRPWCLLEIHAAITHGVPIVSVLVANQFRYSFGAAQTFIDGFEEELARHNPGASEVLLTHGVEPAAMGQMLREHIPNIIAKTFEPSASTNVLSAQITDIIDAMEYARSHAPRRRISRRIPWQVGDQSPNGSE